MPETPERDARFGRPCRNIALREARDAVERVIQFSPPDVRIFIDRFFNQRCLHYPPPSVIDAFRKVAKAQSATFYDFQLVYHEM